MDSSFTFHTLPELEEHLQNFKRFYSIYNAVACPDAYPKLKSRTQRVCRFCRKKYEEKVTTFKSKAHIIPEQLGNKYLISDFECDECNNKFSGYEDNLANFIGPIRTLHKIQGKNGIPKYKSTSITAQEVSLLNQSELLEIKRTDIDNDNCFMFDEATRTIKFRMKKHPYQPLKVYKAFLKIALGCLPEYDIRFNLSAINFLNTDTVPDLYAPFLQIHRTSFPLSYNLKKPYLFVFKKRNKWLNMPMYCFALYTMNYIYQFLSPFHDDDNFIFNQQQNTKFLYSPPLGIEPWNNDVVFDSQIISMASDEIINNEIEEIVMGGIEQPSEVLQIDTLNKTVKESKNYSHDLSKLMGVVLIPKGTSVKIPDDFNTLENN